MRAGCRVRKCQIVEIPKIDVHVRFMCDVERVAEIETSTPACIAVEAGNVAQGYELRFQTLYDLQRVEGIRSAAHFDTARAVDLSGRQSRVAKGSDGDLMPCRSLGFF